jgi:hypothetical protein
MLDEITHTCIPCLTKKMPLTHYKHHSVNSVRMLVSTAYENHTKHINTLNKKLGISQCHCNWHIQLPLSFRWLARTSDIDTDINIFLEQKIMLLDAYVRPKRCKVAANICNKQSRKTCKT